MFTFSLFPFSFNWVNCFGNRVNYFLFLFSVFFFTYSLFSVLSLGPLSWSPVLVSCLSSLSFSVTDHIEAVTAHKGCGIPHVSRKARTKDATADTEAVPTHTEHVTAHTEVATSHTVTVTAYTAPGTIKPPFESTATAHEKNGEAILFERGVSSSDPHRSLNSRLQRLTEISETG